MSYSVLHLNYSDSFGGAARSAYKIHAGLRDLGWNSRMLVREKGTPDPDTQVIYNHSTMLRVGDGISRKIFDRGLSLQFWYYPSSFALKSHPWFQMANVVQLHNLHSCFFSYRALPEISQLKPVVWRLADMWAFTGHCAYSYGCDRWQRGCGQCPHLNVYPRLRHDTTSLLWREKRKVYHQSALNLVVTNRWMESLVKKSPLLSHCNIYRIPNGINTQVFKPVPKAIARESLQIPPTAKVILFLAVDITDPRKGFEYVRPLMDRIALEMPDLVLLVVGKNADSWQDGRNYRTIVCGLTESDDQLATVYSAADIYLHPALAENFPNTVLESLACGTPCVAFDVGGMGDIVSAETGYLACYQNGEDLGNGVRQLLLRQKEQAEMGQYCRNLIESEFTLSLQAQRFSNLYSDLMTKTHHGLP